MGPMVECYEFGPEHDPTEVLARLRAQYPGLVVQAFAPGVSRNESFVEMIAAQTLRAGETGRLLARKPEMDLLLRLAGTTQIATAIRDAGAKGNRAFVVVLAGTQGSLKERGNMKGGRRLARRGLSSRELDSVERAALLSAARA